MIRLPVGRQLVASAILMEANHFALYEGFKGPISPAEPATPEYGRGPIAEAGEEIARGKCSAIFCAAYGQRPADR